MYVEDFGVDGKGVVRVNAVDFASLCFQEISLECALSGKVGHLEELDLGGVDSVQGCFEIVRTAPDCGTRDGGDAGGNNDTLEGLHFD